MAAALVAIALLVAGLGAERFGVRGMAWGLVGYFSVLDLGLGRALTQMVAERLDTEAEADIPALAWTAIPLMLAFGLVGALAIVLPAEYLVRRSEERRVGKECSSRGTRAHARNEQHCRT